MASLNGGREQLVGGNSCLAARSFLNTKLGRLLELIIWVLLSFDFFHGLIWLGSGYDHG